MEIILPTPIEQQPWWNDLLLKLKSRKLRDLARDYGVSSVVDLQEALERTGHVPKSGSQVSGTTAPGPLPTPAAAAPTPARRTRNTGTPAAPPAAVAAPATGGGRAKDRLEGARHLLGQVADGDIAERIGVARKTVVEFRKRHGIERYRGAGSAPPTPVAPAPAPRRGRPPRIAPAPAAVPTGAAAPAATAPSVRSTATGRASKLDDYRTIVGFIADGDVAAQTGMTSENVRMYRKRRGIPAFWREATEEAAAPVVATPAAATPAAEPARRGRPRGPSEGGSKVDRALARFRDVLGSVPDAEIALQAKVSRSAVSAYRQRFKIAASGRVGRPRKTANVPPLTLVTTLVLPLVPAPVEAQQPAPAPAAPAARAAVAAPAPPVPAPPVPAPIAAPNGGYVYRVKATQNGEKHIFGLVAVDPVAAAREAFARLSARDSTWVIQSIRLLSDALPA